jgi:predicted transcriptional regulator
MLNCLLMVKPSQKRWLEEHQAELIEYRKKRHAEKQPRVPDAELERLRLPENRQESLCYGTEEHVVCLNCGRVGKNISHHLHGCPVTLEPSDAYKERWGFDRSNPLTSPKQREAYSQSHRQSPTFRQQQEKAREALLVARAARTGSKRGPMRLESKLRRRGKRTGARPHRQKIPDAEVLEILALNLPIAEAARHAGISQTAFYRRAQRLGWDAEPAKEQQNKILERVFELRTWLFSQPKTPTVEGITQRYVNELRLGKLQHSPDLTSFMGFLEAELRARPEAIGELVAEEGKLAPRALTLASRIFKRAREPKRVAASKHAGRPKGMTRDRIEEGRKLEALIEKRGGKRGAVKEAAMEVYSDLREDLAYDRARQTRKDYGRWKATNREKN